MKGSIKDSYTFKSKFGVKGYVLGRLAGPTTLAIDANGDIYVGERNNNRVQIFNKDGTSPRIFQKCILWPISMAFHPDGDLVVLGANGVVHILDPKGNPKSQFGTRGKNNGQMVNPLALAIDPKGDIVIADTGNSRIQVLTKEGTWIKTIEHPNPHAVAVDLFGNIYVGDCKHSKVQVLNLEGTLIREFGENGEGDHQFEWITAVHVDQHGNVIVSDSDHSQVKIFDKEGNFLMKLGTIGIANDDGMTGPRGTIIDQHGNLLVADEYTHRVTIFG